MDQHEEAEEQEDHVHGRDDRAFGVLQEVQLRGRREVRGEKRALDACLSFAAKQPKKANTINYHLQRLSRMAKR